MYGKGISREGSLLDIGVDLGLVKKSGAWYTYDGEQLGQGRENAKTFLTENPEIMVEISERILAQVGIGQTRRRRRPHHRRRHVARARRAHLARLSLHRQRERSRGLRPGPGTVRVRVSTPTGRPTGAGSLVAVTARTYAIRTYGCQMNEHDSERLAGLLEADGLVPAASDDDADVVVLNTCCIRENADNKLYGKLGHLKSKKDARPGMEIVVGGCLAQKDRDLIAPTGRPRRRRGRHPQRAPCRRAAARGSGVGAGRRDLGRGHGRRRVVPLRPRREARGRLLGLGHHPGRLRQHLRLLHRARRCGARRSAARSASSSPRSSAWPPTVSSRSPSSART